MGEIAEGMMDGTLCVSCGAYIGSDEDHPIKCRDCDKRPRVEPNRMQSTRHDLIGMGCQVGKGPDHKSYSVIFPGGKRFNFWPYTGWFAGPTQGRGFKNLVKAGK